MTVVVVGVLVVAAGLVDLGGLVAKLENFEELGVLLSTKPSELLRSGRSSVVLAVMPWSQLQRSLCSTARYKNGRGRGRG